MTRPFRLGSAVSKAGSIQYGSWEAFTHPTGQIDSLPVIIARGRRDGPCLWLTTGIHGPEHTGPLVIYNLLTQDLVKELRGTIVALPALTPGSLLTQTYVPFHVEVNPNRLWPDGRPQKPVDPEKHPPYALEQAFARLFQEVLNTADYLIDFHNDVIGSLSYVFQDRVLYRSDRSAEKHRAEAQRLVKKQETMIAAYGHTVVTEFPAGKYIKEDLHRSTSGAALLLGRIPTFTAELGTGLTPEPAIVAAAAAGTRNVMRWAGMLAGEMESITGIEIVAPGFRARRTLGVRTPINAVVRHLVEAGDPFKPGDGLADLLDVWGRPVGEVRAEHDGFVIGRAQGIYFYAGDMILSIAIRDRAPLVAPYPRGYFKG